MLQESMEDRERRFDLLYDRVSFMSYLFNASSLYTSFPNMLSQKFLSFSFSFSLAYSFFLVTTFLYSFFLSASIVLSYFSSNLSVMHSTMGLIKLSSSPSPFINLTNSVIGSVKGDFFTLFMQKLNRTKQSTRASLFSKLSSCQILIDSLSKKGPNPPKSIGISSLNLNCPFSLGLQGGRECSSSACANRLQSLAQRGKVSLLKPQLKWSVIYRVGSDWMEERSYLLSGVLMMDFGLRQQWTAARGCFDFLVCMV